MSRMIRNAGRVTLVLAVMLMLGVASCGGSKTKSGGGSGSGGGGRGGSGRGAAARQVSDEDRIKLEEARQAAERAERELSDLRLERMQLESQR